MKEFSLSTRLVHSGERRQPPKGSPVVMPIYSTVTYTYESMAETEKVLAGEGGDFIYSRYMNPTVAALEDALVSIENGKVAVAYGSGMAAIHASLAACGLVSGSIVLASQDLYGASYALLEKVFAPFGVRTETADFDDLEALRTNVNVLKPTVLLAETISNPLLKVCDIAAVAEIAHEMGAKLIVDNTFASPYLCQPLTLGADLVVHSATKYLGGHADATGGIVVSNNEADLEVLSSIKKLVGGVLSVWEAHHILRGIKTLGLRLERQCHNAKVLAAKLRENENIGAVYYPDASRTLREPYSGALVTIRLADDTRAAAFRFMDSLHLCIRATSLGDVYTLVSHSASSSHRELSPETRAKLRITEGLVRISVGIEDISDIIDDIENALTK